MCVLTLQTHNKVFGQGSTHLCCLSRQNAPRLDKEKKNRRLQMGKNMSPLLGMFVQQLWLQLVVAVLVTVIIGGAWQKENSDFLMSNLQLLSISACRQKNSLVFCLRGRCGRWRRWEIPE